MIEYIRDPKVKIFIKDHINDDPDLLVLEGSKFPDIPIKFVATQIGARQKSRVKLPFVEHYPGFVFPSKRSYEQSSSELSANYKSELVKGDSLLDLSGGLGIDCLFFSKHFGRVLYIERDLETFKAATHNFSELGKKNIEGHNITAEEFLKIDPFQYDLIYLDPSRRDQTNKRLVRLEDCEPNVPELLPDLLKKSNTLLIKAAPLLDIKQTLNTLKNVFRVEIVAIENECREVLYQVQKGFTGVTKIRTMNFLKRGIQEYAFDYVSENKETIDLSAPLQYLYEPNAAILKAGAFKSIGKSFGLKKIHENTHLYTHESLVSGFPGRIFRIIDDLKLNKRELRRKIPDQKANISTRNYPLTVAEIRKKSGLKEGGDLYIFAFQTIYDQKALIITEKIIEKPTI